MAVVAKNATAIPRSGIRDVFDRVEQIPDAISLCLGEPGETASAHVVEAACKALQAGKTKYTDVLGIPEFRNAAASYTRRVKGLDYDPETEIQAVDGATIGLYLAIKTVVDPGDEVIIPSPYFTSYDAEVLMCDAVPVTVALKPEHGMHVNADEIRKAITPRTRAIIINSPCNPTGAVTSAEELAEVAKLCEEFDLWVISDEVYHPFVFASAPDAQPEGDAVAPSIAAAEGMKDRTIVVESLSKTYAMTGWRIGYLLAPSHVIEQSSKIAEMMHSSINSSAQYGAIAALNGPQDHVLQMREEYRAKRSLVLDALSDCEAVNLIEPQGAFYVFVDVRPTGLTSEEFSRKLLEEEKVAVVPGEAFGAEGSGFVRLSYAGNADDLKEAVARMRKFALEQQAKHAM
ncbi:aminotransferase class I/II-fold pyridoxal phosphate-dependent enzyme [Bifidobacteriaceae bacterium NR002]|nr:aminotransferase class I/II-fold pyridoxal phosphate-dependent enzyme [Bifidobacteriaceae bacterium NR002]MDZ7549132.1 pyridoxal phosphate-dependent aminotransferase [Bifidobacteriaceae bacterium NR047]